MKKKIIYAIATLLIFAVGFVAGSKYRAYQVRSALSEAFSDFGSDTSTKESSDLKVKLAAKNADEVVIQKIVGDEVILATVNLKVLSVNERQSISASYGSPKVAQEDAKFVVLNMDITNTTDTVFYFSPDFILIDSKDRKYNFYSGMIGNITDYLMGDLAPSIRKNGNVVYEIPTDSDSYSLMIAKAGTNEVYKIVLK